MSLKLCQRRFSSASFVSLGFLFFFTHGQKVLMMHFRYVGMSRAYTKGLATELKAESQTPGRRENYNLALQHKHFLGVQSQFRVTIHVFYMFSPIAYAGHLVTSAQNTVFCPSKKIGFYQHYMCTRV